MPAIIIYLIKLTCSLSITWLFYRLVLRSLTFYTLNRWYLLGYSLLSFLIPFIDIGPIRGEDPALQPLIIQYIPVIGKPVEPATFITIRVASWDPWNYLLLLFALGSCLLLVRFAIRWYSLRRMRRKAVLVEEGPVRIFRVEQPIAPFSFGNAIYVNPEQHTEKEWEEIILHEYVHIRQRHTVDILLAEFLVITNWYNPFAWLICYSIRQNLEFIADRAVVENGHDKKGYQYHLLKVIGQNRYRLANNFNFSSLKKRIVMMNKMRSARLHLLRFLFILPLLTVLLVAFRDRFPLHHTPDDLYVNAAGIVITLASKAPLAGVIVREKNTGLQTVTDENGYYKLRIPAKKDSVHIHLDYVKQGYDATSNERFWPVLRQTTGICNVPAMTSPHDTARKMFMDAPNFITSPTPADPGFEDAFHALQQVLKANEALNNYIAMEKLHPEIGLFYVTEDKQKRILVHTDGTAERYGYPGTPSLADMDAKYGRLPGFMTSTNHLPNGGYLARWAAISAQAEKDFHPNKGNAKAIIFPGDSRVIAVSADGKAQVYDMDNDDPKERPAFEERYGPLHPVTTPRPADNPDTGKPTIVNKPTIVMDHRNLPDTALDTKKALYVIDGVIKGEGSLNENQVQPSDIASITILKRDEAIRIFGARGANGVVAIITKSNQADRPRIVIDVPTAPDSAPLYVVDGQLAQGDALKSMDPGEIESITVLRDQSAKAVYGEKARNGVILITTKKASRP
jgi:TonB-dependent SusC/RagA subfamily outer membrane receptor